MTTFKEGYKGDWSRAVQSNVLGGEMFGYDRSFEMKLLEAFSLRKWKVHMGINITNFNENYSMGANIVSLNEQQSKEA